MANSIDIVVPDLGDFSDVEVIEVLVSDGDRVAREDGLITLETDKASMDVPSPDDGVIESLTVSAGDRINSGDVIGKMTVEAAGAEQPASETVAESQPQEASRPASEAPASEAPAGGERTLVVPDIGDFTDVEVIEVHVSEGQEIEAEDPLITLETDKASMDVPAEAGGKITSVLVAVGDKVSKDSPVAVLETAGAAAKPVSGKPAAAPPPAAKPHQPEQPTAQPAKQAPPATPG